MNKTELAVQLSKKADLTMKNARELIDFLFSADPREGIISHELTRGHKVQITGFGTFESRKRKSRKGRNPQTGADIVIPSAKSPVFTAGKSLKNTLNKR